MSAAGPEDFNFVVGEIYYSSYFVDEELLFPIVWSYIYLGKNLLKTETSPTWYFQDCESFARHGSFLIHRDPGNDGAEGQVFAFTSDAASNVLPLVGFIEELRSAETRRRVRAAAGY